MPLFMEGVSANHGMRDNDYAVGLQANLIIEEAYQYNPGNPRKSST